MGLPIFREPPSALPAPATKSDATARTRSTIRRQRTVREPRRQAEVHSLYSGPRVLRAVHGQADLYTRFIDPDTLRSGPSRGNGRDWAPESFERHYPRPPRHHGPSEETGWRTHPGWDTPPLLPDVETRHRPHFSMRLGHLPSELRSGNGSNVPSAFFPSAFLPQPVQGATSRDISARSRRLEMLQDSGPRPLGNTPANPARVPNADLDSAHRYAYAPHTHHQSVRGQTSEVGEAREPHRHARRPQSRRGPVRPSRIPELDGFPPLRRYTNHRVRHNVMAPAAPRDWSPESDQWETMLSTITPDTHLPSNDSSFTSAVASSSSNDSASSSVTHITAPPTSEFEQFLALQHVCDDSCYDHDEVESDAEPGSSQPISHVPPTAPSPPPVRSNRPYHWNPSNPTDADELPRHPVLTRTPDLLPSLSRSHSQHDNTTSLGPRDNNNSPALNHERVINELIRRYDNASIEERTRFQISPAETQALVESTRSRAHHPSYIVRALQIVTQTNGTLRRALGRSISDEHNGPTDIDLPPNATYPSLPSPYPWTFEPDYTGARLLANPYAIERDIDTNEPRMVSLPSNGYSTSDARTRRPLPPQAPSHVETGLFADPEPTPPSSRSPSSASLRRSFLSHAAEYSRRHMPGVHDEDAEGELDQMRRILERLQQSEDVPDSWWASAGLRREV